MLVVWGRISLEGGWIQEMDFEYQLVNLHALYLTNNEEYFGI